MWHGTTIAAAVRMTLGRAIESPRFQVMRNFIWSVVGVFFVTACLGVLAAELYLIGWTVFSILSFIV
jgi:hypothetical protein